LRLNAVKRRPIESHHDKNLQICLESHSASIVTNHYDETPCVQRLTCLLPRGGSLYLIALAEQALARLFKAAS